MASNHVALALTLVLLFHLPAAQIIDVVTPEDEVVLYGLEEPEEDVVEEGFVRLGGTFNDPRDFVVENAACCHELCRRVAKCVSWSRDRWTGSCALKDIEAPFVQNDRFDAGVIDGVPAVATTAEVACFVEEGVAYPNGRVRKSVKTSSVDECCELCREDVDCFSWYRVEETGMCTMNENVPPQQIEDDVHGASLF